MERRIENWHCLSKYPYEVRMLIYMTNAIEDFNRQLRKITNAKSVFLMDDAPLKMFYLAMIYIRKKRTRRREDWGITHSRFEAYFEERPS